MAKHFKLRLGRVIATVLQSCRSKDPSILPEDPVPSFSTLNPDHRNRRPAFNHHVSSTFIYDGAAPGFPPNKHLNGTHLQESKWQKEEKWHVVAKIYEHPAPRRKIYASSGDDLSFAQPEPPSMAEKNKSRGKKKKNNVPSRFRLSTSSADSGWFSGRARDEEETETLVSSSLSFSTDSSFQRRHKRRVSKRGGLRPPPTAAAARLSTFRKLIPCTVDGKVKESFAMVKRSEDPYEDFKNSMMDMIVEKQMFDSKDLEQLLLCFLSLNSKHYHGMIVEAFSEIWECIFFKSDTKTFIQNHRRVSRD